MGADRNKDERDLLKQYEDLSCDISDPSIERKQESIAEALNNHIIYMYMP